MLFLSLNIPYFLSFSLLEDITSEIGHFGSFQVLRERRLQTYKLALTCCLIKELW